MFVLVEVQSTVNAKELAQQFEELAMLGATVVQVHVNVAKKEPSA
jgi:hypothetical protein